MKPDPYAALPFILVAGVPVSFLCGYFSIRSIYLGDDAWGIVLAALGALTLFLAGGAGGVMFNRRWP